MDMLALELLAQFCAEQRSDFSRDRWLVGNPISSRMLGVVAHYLSMTSWYGHEVELEMIAEDLLPGISDKRCFNKELRELAPYMSYLSASVRVRIEMSRMALEMSSQPGTYTRTTSSVVAIADCCEAD